MGANIQNQTQLITFAKQLVNLAAQKKVDLRIFGGIAVRIHCAIHDKPSDNQVLRDIDFIAKIGQLNQADDFFKFIKFDLIGNPEFSSYGEHRIYQASKVDYGSAVKLDVYFGRLSFNHTIPEPYFQTQDKFTIPITQLLLSKLAIVQLTQKDIADIISIIAHHEIGTLNQKEVIRKDLLSAIWCKSFKGWGIAKTCEINLLSIQKLVLQNHFEENLKSIPVKLEELLNIIHNSSKSVTWKIRNAFGVKLKYYKDASPVT